ncbi:uncharacterized protein LOC131931899 [Physella acuta]|uniref:uncharacterized protein LOC131931899 n=1 Tax=Physella acuta TaxID=109671 RepID=UPI0027DBA176|nr:uncharacterized protein LOC131931899 [Physella acuta]
MSGLEVTKKVSHLDTFHEDVFTDDIIKIIAASAVSQKGKKKKLVLNKTGMKLIQSRFLQERKVETFPISEIKAVEKTPNSKSTIMFVMSDPKKKYKILAFKCSSEEDVILLTSIFSKIKSDMHSANVELRKRENGNWTLSQRSAHNANRHLTEIFVERKQPYDEIATKSNGNVAHVPVLDRSKTEPIQTQSTSTFIKRSNNNNNNYNNNNNHHTKPVTVTTTENVVTITNEHGQTKVKDLDDDYVIETEVSPYPYASIKKKPHDVQDVESVRDELENLTYEVRELRARLDSDRPDGSVVSHSLAPSVRYHSGPVALPSRPVVYATSSHVAQPVVYRAPPKTYEARMSVHAGYYTNPWASHRRLTGEFAGPPRVLRRHLSGESDHSSKMKYETDSVISKSSHRSRSTHKSEFSIPTTIPRTIEDTYGRHTIVRRRDPAQVYLVRPRPHTYHDVVL